MLKVGEKKKAVIKNCVSVGVNVEIVSPSTPTENETWKRVRVKISN